MCMLMCVSCAQADQLFRLASCLGSFTPAEWPEGHRSMTAQGLALPDLKRLGERVAATAVCTRGAIVVV